MNGDENCWISGKLHRVKKDTLQLFLVRFLWQSAAIAPELFLHLKSIKHKLTEWARRDGKTDEYRLHVSVGVPLQMFRKVSLLLAPT